MPNQPVRASAIALPNTDEPAFMPTDAGRAYLLLQDIVARLEVDGQTATLELTPALAAELAAFASEGDADV